MRFIVYGEEHAEAEIVEFFTLGDLLDLAKSYPNHAFKLVGTELGILEVGSWRGSYDIPSLRPTKDKVMGADLIRELTNKIGGTMFGYKGGEYRIYGDSEFYVSAYGSSEEYKVFHHYEVTEDEITLYTDIDKYWVGAI
jgi:hypothetical protein